MIAQFFIVFKDYLIKVLPFLAIGFFLSGLLKGETFAKAHANAFTRWR